ncbi:MAG TPA: hypothetical protein VKB78_01810 [Pirellulales bacterium]|nr:hypothetical protein [Pirellulales bacterium]
MADYLTEKDWKDQLKKHKGVKDTGISEQLREYEKYAEKDFAKALAALKKLSTKIEAAKKEYKANKELCKYLGSMSGEAEDEQETLEKKLKGEDDDEGPDKLLNKALRKAKTGEMFFAVIAKSATDGKLLMGRDKVPATELAEAKKSLGGGQEYRGLCAGEDGTHVFYFRKDPPGTMAQLLKNLAKDDAGLTIKVECRTKADLGDTGEADDLVATAGNAGRGPTADSPQIKAYVSVANKWVRTKTEIEKSIQSLQKALRDSGDVQAAAVARGLERLLGRLPDVGLSLARLSNATKGGQDNAIRGATAETRNAMSACVAYLSNDPLVADVESNPFVKVELKKSLGGVLAETKKTCPALK